MIRACAFVLAVALLTGLGGRAWAQEELPSPSLPIVQTGEAVTGELEGEVTAKLYAFNATQGDQVTVTMAPADDATFDPYLVVLGAAGQVLGVDDNSGSVERAAQVTVNIPFNGTYFALATDFTAVDGIQVNTFPEAQTFLLSVGGNTYPPEVAEQLFYFRTPLQTGTSFEGYSSPPEPVYYFAFEGEAGDTVSLVLTSLDIDTLVMLFDDNGDRIAINDDAETLMLPNATDSAIETLELPTDGAYLVFATVINFYEAPTADQVDADPEAASEQYEGGDFVITLEG